MKDKKQLKVLLLRSRELFMQHGVKALTMDQIAKELGMSKKTIYQFVENKADLVKLTLEDYLEEDQAQLNSILQKATNSVDEMIQMMEYFLQVVRNFDATALNDIQNYYPKAWAIYNEYRFHFMLNRLKANLTKGVKEGFYRAELDTEVISKIYLGGVEILTNQDLFPAKQYLFFNIYREFLNYHLRGIVSPIGLKHLEEHNLFKA